ncbi:hypothetical protein ACJX0J_018837 [Zea mays]
MTNLSCNLIPGNVIFLYAAPLRPRFASIFSPIIKAKLSVSVLLSFTNSKSVNLDIFSPFEFGTFSMFFSKNILIHINFLYDSSAVVGTWAWKINSDPFIVFFLFSFGDLCVSGTMLS